MQAHTSYLGRTHTPNHSFFLDLIPFVSLLREALTSILRSEMVLKTSSCPIYRLSHMQIPLILRRLRSIKRRQNNPCLLLDLIPLGALWI